MRLSDVSEALAGAVRCYGGERFPRPEGAGYVIGRAGEVLVAKGNATVAVYRAAQLRTILHVDAAFIATFAACGVVFLAVDRGKDTELVRWELASGALSTMSRVPGQWSDLASNAEASRIVLHRDREVVVHEGARGARLWGRDLKEELPEDEVEWMPPVQEIALEGDAVVLYMDRYDRDEPDYTYAIARVAPVGDIATRQEILERSDPSWYTPPSKALGGFVPGFTENERLLVIAPDGSRVATPNHAWTVPGGELLSVAQLESWWGSSFASAGTYQPLAIAYDGDRELLRISTGHGRFCMETCHQSSTAVELPEGSGFAIVPGSRRVVVAMKDEVRLDDQVLLAEGGARAIACADDGSAIAVALADRVALFDRGGAAIGTLSLPSSVGLAVARGGGAAACVDGRELVIVRADRVVRGPANARKDEPAVALSPDGSLVAYATASWGFAILDARTAELRIAHEDLPSPVNAIAFAPDGKTVFALGADGRIAEWSVLLKLLK
jgi:hypothetical protein